MGFITGRREFAAESLTITLDALPNARTRISTQYSYSHGGNVQIYPAAGWLDIKVTPDGIISGTDISFFLVPGTSGVPSGGFSATDAQITTFGATQQSKCFFLGSVAAAQLADGVEYQHRILLGPNAHMVRAANSDEALGWTTAFNDVNMMRGELPRFWSLAVRNSSGVALAASGNTATFTPVFDYVVSA